MWSGWAERLADDLEATTGVGLREPLFAMLGYDAVARRARAGGRLSATPMARLRELTGRMLVDIGVRPTIAAAALAAAWHAPDPVALAHPLADLGSLLAGLRAAGRRVAVVTSDDREPTERTLDALGIAADVDAVVCADDDIATKPAPDAVLHVCRLLGVEPGRTAVVGDAPADIAMGRAAGAALVIGVRTGVATAADLDAADLVLDGIHELVPRLAP